MLKPGALWVPAVDVADRCPTDFDTDGDDSLRHSRVLDLTTTRIFI
jgi:hypothetical protein